MSNVVFMTQKRKITKIVIDRSRCIGASSCIGIAPDVYELDAENIAVVKDERGAADDTLVLSAQSCPTSAIFLYDEAGNQIYPEQQDPLLFEEG